MNVIELVTKFLPMLDEQYKMEAKSSVLDVLPEFVQMTNDAKKVKIAKMRVDGLATYSRANGFTAGTADLVWEEHEFTQDRGRAIQIDNMDNTETFGLAFGRLAGEFQRTKVIPEIDAYRFSTYFKNAGTKTEINIASGEILKFIDDADAQMDDDEVPEEGRILFVNPTIYKLMMNDPDISKSINVTSVPGMVNKKFYEYNGHLIVKVPSTRFYTNIELLDGKTEGQESGGYKAAAGAKSIGIMLIHPSAILQLSKRRIARIWAPTREQAAGTDGVNPNADAWKFDFRVYHDAWTLDEKLKGVYAATITGPNVTSVTIGTDDPKVTISSNAATVNRSTVSEFLAKANVVVTNGASTAVTWSSSNTSKASVDGSGNITLLAAGSAVITATSVYDPSKKGTLTLTIQ